jgi:hypothetical protein
MGDQRVKLSGGELEAVTLSVLHADMLSSNVPEARK